MAYTPKKMALSNVASTVETTVYTAPAAGAIVKQIIVANVTATAATISISIVPAAGAAGVTNRIMEQVSLAGNTVTTLDMTAVMVVNDFISIKQGTASAITSHISGVEI